MNSSITVKINPSRFGELSAGAGWPVKVSGWLGSLVKRTFSAQPEEIDAEGVRHLLALADAYEETQPSYAADLRAAALAHDADAAQDAGLRSTGWMNSPFATEIGRRID